MTHKSIPDNKRRAAGVSDSLIRLSVGLEDVEDLIEDLSQSLAKHQKNTTFGYEFASEASLTLQKQTN
jgi:cystathionine beta-lyase